MDTAQWPTRIQIARTGVNALTARTPRYLHFTNDELITLALADARKITRSSLPTYVTNDVWYSISGVDFPSFTEHAQSHVDVS